MSTKKSLFVLVITSLFPVVMQCLVQAQPIFPIDWDKSTCLIETFRPGEVEKATGFFVTNTSDSTISSDTFLVTNRHVAHNADSIKITYEDLDSGNVSRTLYFAKPAQRLNLREHKDDSIDIAAIKLDFVIRVPAYLVSTSNDFGKLTLGDEVYFFGYPFGLNLGRPILRSGIVSFMSNEPLPVKYRNIKYKIKGGVFLIDGFAWEGNSGSPVLSPIHSPEIVMYKTRERFKLSGIIFAYVPTSDSINSGLAIALPAKRITEVIDLFKKK